MAVSGEGESVLPLPGSASRTSLGGGITMTLAKSTRRLAGSGLSAQFAMLLLSLANPLNLRVSADGSMGRVDHDDFVIFVGRVITNPIGIQNAKRTNLATDTFLSNGLERALEFHLIDSMVSGLAVRAALGNGLLTRTAADADAVDHKPLLGAVSQPARLLYASWLRRPVDARQLTVLPSADAKKESHHIALLLTPQFVDILIGAHRRPGEYKILILKY